PAQIPNALRRLVDSSAFHKVVIITIGLAALVIGLRTFPPLEQSFHDLFDALDLIILGIFAIEILLKMGALWPQPLRFFRDGWNVFDFAIVAACCLPVTGSFAPVLRLFRLLRVLRLITAVPRLQLLVSAMIRSLPSMGYVMLLLSLLFYVYAIMGVILFRENDPENFGHLGSALLTLFEVVTMEGWVDLMDAQINGTGGTPPAAPIPQMAPLYFVSFVLIGVMIMLNLVIGVIINAMDEAQRDCDQKALAEHPVDYRSEGERQQLRSLQVRDLQKKLAEVTRELDRLRSL
ncbi:MAG: ion transporter, partial [Verrucomicrobiota bacterium]